MTYHDKINEIMDKQVAKGIEKYGMPLDDNPRPAVEAIDFACEEAVDWLFYLQETKAKVQKLIDDNARKDGEIAYLQTLIAIQSEQIIKYKAEVEKCRRGYRPLEMEE